ncbi:hypothetical protein H2199_008991 [Coniosporium tulheliwenetii]|uniref:Uncharacterized protein n=1 Tax=Coniosporium tulheliwenetii TaxID=3383036 RepID=A0ACC2YGP8_9PEZI|nr:hypothetical protein H2199_008991 [Cladosporium sp. JES 115]
MASAKPARAWDERDYEDSIRVANQKLSQSSRRRWRTIAVGVILVIASMFGLWYCIAQCYSAALASDLQPTSRWISRRFRNSGIKLSSSGNKAATALLSQPKLLSLPETVASQASALANSARDFEARYRRFMDAAEVRCEMTAAQFPAAGNSTTRVELAAEEARLMAPLLRWAEEESGKLVAVIKADLIARAKQLEVALLDLLAVGGQEDEHIRREIETAERIQDSWKKHLPWHSEQDLVDLKKMQQLLGLVYEVTMWALEESEDIVPDLDRYCDHVAGTVAVAGEIKRAMASTSGGNAAMRGVIALRDKIICLRMEPAKRRKERAGDEVSDPPPPYGHGPTAPHGALHTELDRKRAQLQKEQAEHAATRERLAVAIQERDRRRDEHAEMAAAVRDRDEHIAMVEELLQDERAEHAGTREELAAASRERNTLRRYCDELNMTVRRLTGQR